VAIVRRLVAPKVLKAKGVWGRELGVLKRLQKEFADDAFWLQLAPALPLDTLLWFCGEFGHASLKREWDLWIFSKAQDRAQMAADTERAEREHTDRVDALLEVARANELLDSAPSTGMIEGQPPSPPKSKRRQSPIEWCDGGSEM
jgi:hypothetical protein